MTNTKSFILSLCILLLANCGGSHNIRIGQPTGLLSTEASSENSPYSSNFNPESTDLKQENITEKSVIEPLSQAQSNTVITSEKRAVITADTQTAPIVADTKASMTDTPADALKAPEKMIKDMNCQEAISAKRYYESQKESELAMQSALRMITLGSNKEDEKEAIRKAMLEVAQKYFDQGNLEKTEKFAADYQVLYPGTPEAKDAAYLTMQAQFMSTPASCNDQTKTHQTLETAQNFLQKYTDDSKYTTHVQNIIDGCYQKLFMSECEVIRCYLARYNYSKHEAAINAAYKRINYIKDNLLKHAPTLESELLQLEIDLADAHNKPDISKAKKQELEDKYPEQATSFMARAIKKVALRF
jgi:outer membrane protein assembly factor BamD (BamD/ComL family)